MRERWGSTFAGKSVGWIAFSVPNSSSVDKTKGANSPSRVGAFLSAPPLHDFVRRRLDSVFGSSSKALFNCSLS